MSRQQGGNRGRHPAPWIVTFADLMSLLLTFFVLMLALSEIDTKKYEEAMLSIRSAFGQVWHRDDLLGEKPGRLVGERTTAPPVSEPSDTRAEAVPSAPADAAEVLYGELLRLLEAEVAAGQVELERQQGRLIVRFEERISFPTASATLQEPFVPVLDKIATGLETSGKQIVVVGHTDDRPIATERFRSNWDLSSARAASVVHHLLRHSSLEPDAIIAQGRADTQPLVPNDSAANRAKNRRVEIVIVVDEDGATEKAGPGSG